MLCCFYSLISCLSTQTFWRALTASVHNRADTECPITGITNSGRVWRKVPESNVWSVHQHQFCQQITIVQFKMVFMLLWRAMCALSHLRGFKAVLITLTLSLTWRHLKTTNKSTKLEILKPFFFIFFFALACERIFIKTCNTEIRFVIGPENVLFALFSGRHFTGWGSERVNDDLSCLSR